MDYEYLADGTPIMFKQGEDDTPHIACAECGTTTNKTYTMDMTDSTKAWCLACSRNLHYCAKCKSPKYFGYYASGWADYICDKCNERAVQELEDTYDGPEQISFTRATRFYLTEMIKRTKPDSDRANEFLKKNGIGLDIRMITFVGMMCSVANNALGPMELLKNICYKADHEEAIDFVVKQQRSQAYNCLKFKKLDRQAPNGKTHYYQRFKSKQQYYLGFDADDLSMTDCPI